MEEDKIDVAFLLRGMPGIGHVSPGYALGEELTKHRLKCAYISYANGLDFLRNFNLKNIYEIKKPEKTKSRVPWKDMFELCDDVIPLLQKLAPKVVVVDGEIDSLFMLKNLEVKLVHICTPSYIEGDSGVYRRYAHISKAMLRQPDLTIVHGILMNKSIGNVHFVGPMVRQLPDSKVTKRNVHKKITICMTASSDASLIKMSEKIAKKLSNQGYEVGLIGQKRQMWEFVKEPMLSFADSSVVIVNGGLAVIEETVMLGKPIIILSDGDLEKENNSKIIERMRLGKAFSINSADSANRIIDYIKSISSSKTEINIKNGTGDAASLILKIMHK